MKTRREGTSEVEALRAEIARLRASFQETQEVVQAIHGGEVDAVVVNASEQEHAVYTFFGADHPYRMLVESMTEGAVTLSKDGTVLYANPSFGRILGNGSKDLAGSHFAQFVHPADAPRFHAFLAQAGDGKAEMRLTADDGTPVPVYLSRSAADLVGVRGICLVVTDLTEQKKHDEVVASERLARLILEQASEAIVVCDASGRITRASRQTMVLCGQNPLLKRFDEVFDFVFVPDRTGFTSALETDQPFLLQVASGQRAAVRREVTCTGPDGENLHLLLSSSPLVGEHGQVLGAVVILTDITAAKRAAAAIQESERKLRILNETLEQRVAERTAELKRANQVLSQKNRELQDFAYMASHDLQEPLRKISTFAGLLMEELGGTLTENGQFYVGRITAAAQRMSDLLRSLLSYSRIATQANALRPVNLNHVLTEVLSGLEAALSEVELQVQVEDLPTLAADPVQIRQLFSHLISNAIKFRRPEVAPVIRIRGPLPEPDQVRSDGSSGTICIEVEDNGIGFDERYLDRIFSPFQRLHGRSQYPGTGMGLAICRRIVERHYGSITARSVPGQGSIFIITLPVLLADADPEPSGGL